MTSSPELPVVESGDTLEIESPMPVGKRVFFFLLALAERWRRGERLAVI